MTLLTLLGDDFSWNERIDETNHMRADQMSDAAQYKVKREYVTKSRILLRHGTMYVIRLSENKSQGHKVGCVADWEKEAMLLLL